MLYFNTVNELLKSSLLKLMEAEEFSKFRLVGGTALSLQIGHRESIDIDLFSDIEYGTLNFNEIEDFLKSNFKYVDFLDVPSAMGKAYFIGENKDNTVKLDIFYTDTYIQPFIEEDGIRMATIEEIIAMKVDVIQRGGRKKDFWDLHALLDSYSIKQMMDFHEQRYPYTHDKDLIIQNFTNFDQADDDFDPICFKGKYWEFIKEDFEEKFKNNF
ncbi:nucleotidyl transferase AbiEii/AbiGii toxin family protein [Flavobacterium sp. 20NA77.7]|uniref:Nucleotidyl transferase AbiEii/AbiGii toxin family protein n=1 Tax=Flavobacterium nakdongensis TaxID=3073563 RepID=A0ABY9R8I0_9FLAO|nr:nucleotidyl transferase AbiEii/AbiGii toxin family protein [Flavobacterium sp. 20NA77.7]WMW76974.1 nucleotidyl transferase AbiEii/AbiGii toxin family protein [Flavobacterium sp. 20NA77.7]